MRTLSSAMYCGARSICLPSGSCPLQLWTGRAVGKKGSFEWGLVGESPQRAQRGRGEYFIYWGKAGVLRTLSLTWAWFLCWPIPPHWRSPRCRGFFFGPAALQSCPRTVPEMVPRCSPSLAALSIHRLQACLVRKGHNGSESS